MGGRKRLRMFSRRRDARSAFPEQSLLPTPAFERITHCSALQSFSKSNIISIEFALHIMWRELKWQCSGCTELQATTIWVQRANSYQEGLVLPNCQMNSPFLGLLWDILSTKVHKEALKRMHVEMILCYAIVFARKELHQMKQTAREPFVAHSSVYTSFVLSTRSWGRGI